MPHALAKRGGKEGCPVGSDDVARIQRDFEEIFDDRADPKNMVLAQAYHFEPGYTYLIWLSDKPAARAGFLNFRQIEAAALPKKATLLAGHQATFEQYFARDAHKI